MKWIAHKNSGLQPKLWHAVELCMHMRMECLGLNAFHSHRRQGETSTAQEARELCPCCRQAPETPTHFLLECTAYSSPRSALLAGAIAEAQSNPVTSHAPNSHNLGNPVGGGPTPMLETWRVILDHMQPGVLKFVQDAWRIRRAALTGRGANGGHPMALPPVPGLDAA